MKRLTPEDLRMLVHDSQLQEQMLGTMVKGVEDLSEQEQAIAEIQPNTAKAQPKHSQSTAWTQPKGPLRAKLGYSRDVAAMQSKCSRGSAEMYLRADFLLV